MNSCVCTRSIRESSPYLQDSDAASVGLGHDPADRYRDYSNFDKYHRSTKAASVGKDHDPPGDLRSKSSAARRKWLLLEEKLSAKPTDEVCGTGYSILMQHRRIRKRSTSSDPPAAGHLLLKEKAFGANPVGFIDIRW